LHSINFEFILCLEMTPPIFMETTVASNALQRQDLGLAAAYTVVNGVISRTNTLRTEEQFKEIYFSMLPFKRRLKGSMCLKRFQDKPHISNRGPPATDIRGGLQRKDELHFFLDSLWNSTGDFKGRGTLAKL